MHKLGGGNMEWARHKCVLRGTTDFDAKAKMVMERCSSPQCNHRPPKPSCVSIRIFNHSMHLPGTPYNRLHRSVCGQRHSPWRNGPVLAKVAVLRFPQNESKNSRTKENHDQVKSNNGYLPIVTMQKKNERINHSFLTSWWNGSSNCGGLQKEHSHILKKRSQLLKDGILKERCQLLKERISIGTHSTTWRTAFWRNAVNFWGPQSLLKENIQLLNP